MPGGKKTTTTQGKLNPVVDQRISTVFQQDLADANKPYEPYTGELVAPFTPDQEQSMSMFKDVATNNVGGANLQSAIGTTQGVAGFQPSQITAPGATPKINTMFNAPQASTPNAITSRDVTASHTPSMFTAGRVGTDYNPTMLGAGADPRYLSGSAAPARTVGGVAAPARGVDAARDVTADQITPSMFTDLDISRYMNPYTDEVVNRTGTDLDRQRQMALSRSGGEIAGAGAFGGSRHGVADALTNEASFRTAGDTLASLRAAGYDRAADLGVTDLNRKLQADVTNAGNRLTAGQANQAADTTRNLAVQSGQIRADELGLQRGMADQSGAIRADELGLQRNLADQQAGQFSDTLGQQRNLADQSATADAARIKMQGEIQNVASQLQAQGMSADDAYRAAQMQFSGQQTNAANDLTAQQSTAQLAQTADLASLQSRLQTMGMTLDAERFNSDAAYRDSVLQMDAQARNQSAGIAGAGLNLNAAGQLATMAGQERGFATDNASIFGQVGAQQQQQSQAENQAAYQQWLMQQQYEQNQAAMRQNALDPSIRTSPLNSKSTVTQKDTPGALDWAKLGVGAGMAVFGGPAGMAGAGSIFGGAPNDAGNPYAAPPNTLLASNYNPYNPYYQRYG